MLAGIPDSFICRIAKPLYNAMYSARVIADVAGCVAVMVSICAVVTSGVESKSIIKKQSYFIT
jgi:hypothetical protein